MIPSQRERVRIRGRMGVYFVLGVDLEAGFASLLNLQDAMRLEDVPFARIEPFRFEPEPDLPLVS
ncbi:MAG TPA: hypothetical protein VG206_27930 [Terriglobia bacterium]|nr:hypothetical protein [Terriglobia bacterium]